MPQCHQHLSTDLVVVWVAVSLVDTAGRSTLVGVVLVVLVALKKLLEYGNLADEMG